MCWHVTYGSGGRWIVNDDVQIARVPEIEVGNATKEVFETLYRQYRERKKPDNWFRLLDEPISLRFDDFRVLVAKAE